MGRKAEPNITASWMVEGIMYVSKSSTNIFLYVRGEGEETACCFFVTVLIIRLRSIYQGLVTHNELKKRLMLMS